MAISFIRRPSEPYNVNSTDERPAIQCSVKAVFSEFRMNISGAALLCIYLYASHNMTIKRTEVKRYGHCLCRTLPLYSLYTIKANLKKK